MQAHQLLQQRQAALLRRLLQTAEWSVCAAAWSCSVHVVAALSCVQVLYAEGRACFVSATVPSC
jgi:hypothetical protein